MNEPRESLQELEGKLREILASRFPHINLRDDVLVFPGEEMSSLDLVELAIELEHEFGVKFRLAEISEKSFANISSMAQVLAAAKAR